MRLFLFSVWIGLTAALALRAQVAGFPPTEISPLLPSQMRQQESPLRGEQVPSDNAVDARQYWVGPGDVVVIQRLDALAQENTRWLHQRICSLFRVSG